ncbi:hypothetical protein BFU36_01730 [Sulfolobus sp. A20]|uniref:DUF61 family protein n=1 Tax=Sulfolobaceae TaxID=118883 RepID=UPI0008461190|nr:MULTISPECIES: DUF61 family protein [unclassified Sulfolobus]TRM74364.1 DUF61 domain-containing protein [Sulfolobus sp. E5]TRM78175.1 DUF61 domain-containing protein [Sulfolobus sp. A20-N-F8]TRM79376.1 DUF61 domain-containing protein [Sulfolobus sp. B5]TRM84136.1 DUF61 domain-containing protein [Sulfolobus sp. A20-N-F6]TRM88838.1 DUF61 domain-containing protein [Sulfolobus sp. C3]TRM98465.1 DUF61 domain-containing protein [Sulfolobus sp. F1]TRM98623.1 DUF61 domain-containing protein [Sulfo
MIDKIFEIGLKDLFSSTPAEYITLKEALEGKRVIKLNNGFYHELKEDEIDNLSKRVPIYLWSLVKIPLLFTKSTELGEFHINGGEWERKLVSVLLHKEIGNVILTTDVERLLKEYPSLIFIILSPTLFMESESSEM